MYEGDVPWDVGRPQDAVAPFVEDGTLSGRVLDAGCGTGVHAVSLADEGFDVVGVDVAPRAVARANATAHSVGVDVAFAAADACRLPFPADVFDSVLDTGLFHVFDVDTRPTYTAELARVLRNGGRVVVLAFADGAPADWGPTPVACADVERAFAADWRVRETRDATFCTDPHPVPALLAVVERRA